MRFPHFLFFSSLLFTACQNAETGRRDAPDEEHLFFDYQVSAEEGREDATVRLQYKLGDESGEALALEKPAKVLLDGKEIAADSSRLSGTYYELIRPLEELKGRHSIVFIDEEGKEYRQEFTFEPFALAEELPESISKRPFTIRLQNFPPAAETVRLVMTDTALYSTGVNEDLQVENGEIHIDKAMLDHLIAGPISLEISREKEEPIRHGAKAGGRLLLTYSLRRQFELLR